MERNKYLHSKENNFLQDDLPKKMKKEIVNGPTCCVKLESSDLALGRCELITDLLPVIKSAPKESQLIKSNQSSNIEKSQCMVIHPRPTNGNRRNAKELKVVSKDNLDDSNSSGARVKWNVKSFDLNKEEDNGNVVDSKDRNGRKSDDLTEENNVKYKSDIYVETQLHKIPKDILGKYGIVLEDGDIFRNSPSSGERKSSWNEDREEEEEEEEEDEEGELIIDEEEKPVRNTEQENSPRRELSENETDFRAVSFKTEENTAGFTNCGHHLVISSVTSIQWSERCNICEVQLPIGVSLELHKKGHCSFPGCLDFIQDESERKKHLQIHKDHPIKPFRCEYCKRRFHYYRFTKKHREACKVMKRSKCPYCHYSSLKVGQFNKHVAKHVSKLTAQIAGNVTSDQN